MSYEREDFDLPVSDYDLSKTKTIEVLFEQMRTAGGFTATKLVQARDILRNAINDTKKEDQVLNWLSFPACLMATGTRGFFIEAIKSGKVFMEQGLQIAAGVPLECDEGENFMTFRIGLFGLDKLHNLERTVANLRKALDTIRP